MIFTNTEINRNKLEEFIRVLIPGEYGILNEAGEKHVFFDVLEDKERITVKTLLLTGNVENLKEMLNLESFQNFENVENLYKSAGIKIIKEAVFSYEKVCDEYFDQSEVMMKRSLLTLFEKEDDFKWGILIGVRPTKIVGRFLGMGLSYEKISQLLKDIYLVSDEKRNLLINIVKKQEKYLDRETIGIYIGIAFCPTKCSYCSFPAYLLRGEYARKYGTYIDSLYHEIEEIGKFTQEMGLKINTVYIGGGTPSILTKKEIEKMLNVVKESYDLSYLREFTFEAGRIDTLDEEKMKVMKEAGVSKISINPQSFNEKTLKLVNRYHDREEFDNVYEIAKRLGLEINMDLILGLPGETTEDILHTMNEISKYDMENLTIHNLAIKTASRLNRENYEHTDVLDYGKIYEKIDEITRNKGLEPYYMYRQKNSFQWGENLGYSLDNLESVYNIEMIEENKTIIGIGAGAITKLIWKGDKKGKDNIKRLINPKDPLVWINELKERLKNKKAEIRRIFATENGSGKRGKI